MSSIDKYVESTARSIDPRVRVVNSGGRIKGYINGEEVFSLADRYGYLSDNERNRIQQSLNRYEEREQAEIRAEQERLENERIAELNRLRSSVNTAKNNLQASFTNAQKFSKQAETEADFSKELSLVKGYNVQSFEKRIQGLKDQVSNAVKKIQTEYDSRLNEIDRLEKSIRSDSGTATYRSQADSLRRIRTNLDSVKFPLDDIRGLKDELTQISGLLSGVEKIKGDLEKFGSEGAVGALATSALAEIKQIEIKSSSDVEELISSLNAKLEKASSIKFEEESKETIDQVKALQGIASACKALNVTARNLRQNNYVPKTYREEIVAKANSVLRVYSDLENAEFTTCSNQKIHDVYTEIQEINMSNSCDLATLEHVQKMYDEAVQYKMNDSLQEENFADYKKKVEELVSRGYSTDKIEVFDYKNYQTQKARLNRELLKQDFEESIKKSYITYASACRAMDDLGYQMVRADATMDCEVKTGEARENHGLAHEAIFAIPGCNDVVFQVVTTEDGLRRRLIGIQKPDGWTTSNERIREVARIIEESGEIQRYFGAYMEIGGGEHGVTEAVDSDTENCDAEITAMDLYVIENEEESNYFNDIVANASAQEKQKWATKISVQTVQAQSSYRKAQEGSCVDRMRAETGRKLREKRK